MRDKDQVVGKGNRGNQHIHCTDHQAARLQFMANTCVNFRVTQDDQPRYALIDYNVYQALKNRKEPPTGLPPITVDLELLEFIIHGMRLSAEVEKDPSTLVSHAELKRQLAEKKARVGT